jgi:guanylate kinase
LANAVTELKYAGEDAGENFDFQIVNDDLEVAYSELKVKLAAFYPHDLL